MYLKFFWITQRIKNQYHSLNIYISHHKNPQNAIKNDMDAFILSYKSAKII